MYLEVVIVLLIAIVNSIECTETPVSIRRRSRDIVKYQDGTHETCSETHGTFDIASRSCQSSESYFKGNLRQSRNFEGENLCENASMEI